MPKYQVNVRRIIREAALVEVEAESAEDAKQKAEAAVINEDQWDCEEQWVCESSDYITDVDDVVELEDEDAEGEGE